MDQDAYRRTYREMNERFCAYEKCLLAQQCLCSQAKKICIAEREGVHCLSDEAQNQCLELQAALRQQARFALKTNNDRAVLPHAQAMRLQVGGLRGLHAALFPDLPLPTRIDDVNGLISQARETYGSLENLPFQTLIQHVSAYQGRRR
jgi:hypothetical protein